MKTLDELNHFYEKIIKYKKLVGEWSDTLLPTNALRTSIQNLRTELQRSYSRLEKEIAHYGGSSSITDPIFGKKQNAFDIAFDAIDILNVNDNLNALNRATKIVNKAIGKLEAEGESWPLPIGKLKDKSQKPKTFISHSGITDALTKLISFLENLGIEPIVVIKKPHLSRDIDIKVEDCMDEADLALFLATGDAKDKEGNSIPSGNVCHEIGLAQAQAKFKGKIIYLIEEGAQFPSNIKPKGYIDFNRNNIEHKFGDIVKEIKGMGFL